jgi:uncharacterized membrane protein
MEPKRSKYDTNPLDENVADRATRAWGRDTAERPDAPTQDVSGATREIRASVNQGARNSAEAEAPTRRMDDSYPSVFAYGQPRRQAYEPPPPIANIYQPPPVPLAQVYQPPPAASAVAMKPGSRKVAGLGIPEKWAVILPYIPFFLAIGVSVAELLLVPRSESRVRFHAAQGMVLQIAITAITILLGFADLFSGRLSGGGLFRAATFVFLIISMIRVWKGKPHHITILDQATNWINEKIAPRK